MSLRLGVNVDHVATLRQARYAKMPEPKKAERDPLVAARLCEEAGAGCMDAHPSGLANAFTPKIQKEELEHFRAAARAASESHLQVNVGHGINYKNIALIHHIPDLSELNIGHAIISRAMWVGLESAVKEMLAAMANYPG